MHTRHTGYDKPRADKETALTPSGESQASLVQVDDRGRITIPKKVREALELEEGVNLMLRVAEDRLELVPMTLVPRDQGWFYREEVQDRLAEASRDVKAGRTEEVESVAELERHLGALRTASASDA